jgi:hypothetical protein
VRGVGCGSSFVADNGTSLDCFDDRSRIERNIGAQTSNVSKVACAVQRRRFPAGASPARRSLQPEATGAGMEVTKCLKPSGKAATIWWQRECAGRNASER